MDANYVQVPLIKASGQAIWGAERKVPTCYVGIAKEPACRGGVLPDPALTETSGAASATGPGTLARKLSRCKPA
jgi:hypothetical protein